MLHLLDESMEAFLRATVPLRRDVKVVFEAPDGEWAAGVSGPTVNLYLWDVRPNLAERSFGEELASVDGDDGRRVRRRPLPVVDCRYLVTAWTTEVRDEHSLLGSVLSALLLHPQLSAEHLAGELSAVRPLPKVELRSGDGTENSDFWNALGGQLKPGLDVVVTAPVDAALSTPAGPPVEEVQTDATPVFRVPPDARPLSEGAAAGEREADRLHDRQLGPKSGGRVHFSLQNGDVGD